MKLIDLRYKIGIKAFYRFYSNLKFSKYILLLIIFFLLKANTNNPDIFNLKKSIKFKDTLSSKKILIKLSHHINTYADEYLPVYDSYNNTIYFTAMDRTGYFDFKIDFTKNKNAGGEDIYKSELKNGLWIDARPLNMLNTNSHESVNYVFKDGSLILTANYPENIGPVDANEGMASTDLFKALKNGNNAYQIFHYPEPINSLYGEFDAITDSKEKFLIFSSDRPGGQGKYHKKGWSWNGNYWGNSDIYVSINKDGNWSNAINLGNVVNTDKAERTPWLSKDGKKLFISSNGHSKVKSDMDIYFFKRENINEWDKWVGPFPLMDINTNQDEWGLKIYDNDLTFFARSLPLDFVPNQIGKGGDGGFRETNFRIGYDLNGAQSAALRKEFNTEIFQYSNSNIPWVVFDNILFEFNSAKIKSQMFSTLDALIDLCHLNMNYKIKIIGHTDNIGSNKYNIELSNNRCRSIVEYLKSNGVKNEILSIGKGSSQPLNRNVTENDREVNRRVEIYFLN